MIQVTRARLRSLSRLLDLAARATINQRDLAGTTTDGSGVEYMQDAARILQLLAEGNLELVDATPERGTIASPRLGYNSQTGRMEPTGG